MNPLTERQFLAGRLLTFALFGLLASMFSVDHGHAQTAPTPQTLPYTQDFGASTFTAAPAGIAVTGEVVADSGPVLEFSPATLAPFETTVGAPSAEKTFSLAARGLRSTLTITAPAGFELAVFINGVVVAPFAPVQTFTPASSGLYEMQVALRMTGAAAGIYNGTVSATAGSASAAVAVAGVVFGTGSDPELLAQPGELTGFETAEEVPSAPQTFIAAGRNLDGPVAVLSTNPYFELTTDPADADSWAQSVDLPVGPGGNLAATLIHVRLAAIAASGDVAGFVDLDDPAGASAQVELSGYINRIRQPEVRLIKPDQSRPFTRIDPGIPYVMEATATATATDAEGQAVGIAKVEFLVDGVPVGEDDSKPYNFSYNFVFEGTYQVRARATDVLGNVGVSGVGTVEVRAPLPGELIETFVPPKANGAVRALGGDSSGRVYLGGEFTALTSAAGFTHPEPRLARLTKTGAVDTGFKIGSGPNARVRSLVVVGDGVVFGGDFTSVDGSPRVALAKVGTNGKLATGFDAKVGGSLAYVQAIAVQPDGKILIGGSFSEVLGQMRSNIARLVVQPDGSVALDSAFSASVNGIVNAIALQPDGKILVGGSFNGVNGVTSRRIARLDPNGATDATFIVATGSNNGFNGTVNSIAVSPTGSIYVGGEFTSYRGAQNYRHLARLQSGGTLDGYFNAAPGLNAPVTSVLALPAGDDVVVAGQFTSMANAVRLVPNTQVGRVVQMRPDGLLAPSFNPGGQGADGEVTSAVALPDGNWLLAGAFTKFNGYDRSGLALLAGAHSLGARHDFETWRKRHFVASELSDPAIASGEVVNNGAGINNLLVYALSGVDPRAATRDILPVAYLGLGEAGAKVPAAQHLYLRVPKNPGAAAFCEYIAEFSNDLAGTWSSEGVTKLSEDASHILFRAPLPSSQNIRQFLRLKVLQR